jgi:hypothetical protein
MRLTELLYATGARNLLRVRQEWHLVDTISALTLGAASITTLKKRRRLAPTTVKEMASGLVAFQQHIVESTDWFGLGPRIIPRRGVIRAVDFRRPTQILGNGVRANISRDQASI